MRNNVYQMWKIDENKEEKEEYKEQRQRRRRWKSGSGRFREHITVYVQYTYSIRTVYVTVYVKNTTVYVDFILEDSIS